MILWIIVALGLGIYCGQGGMNEQVIQYITNHSDVILYLLMLSVGISVGTNKEIVHKVREMDARVWILPIGVVIGSLLGGIFAYLFNGLTLSQNLGISSGLGWYSLSGVMLSDFYGADIGAITFLSNLLREFLSFLAIPLVAKYLNEYAAIAICGATSEDTTLPILIRCTSSEFIIFSVINGVVTSACVPFLIRAFTSLNI